MHWTQASHAISAIEFEGVRHYIGVMREKIGYQTDMRQAHSRFAFTALDKLIDRHYIMDMREKTMTNSTRLITSLHIAEDGFDAAMNAMDWVAATRWWEIIERESGELRLALRMEDPHTTMADVRFFEEFKYVE